MEINMQKAYTIALDELKVLQNELILYKAFNEQLQEEINELKKEKVETKQNKE